MESTARNVPRWTAAALLALVFSAASVCAQVDSTLPPTNLSLFRLLAGNVAASAFDSVGRDDTATVQLTVFPRENGWLIEDAMSTALRRKDVRLTAADAPVTAEFGILRLQVAYDNIRSDGIFGTKVVDRIVLVGMRARIVDHRSSSVLLSRDIGLERHDTVAVANIDHLENPTIPVTHGALPPEGWFTNALEPLILLGTIALAVVLLFTVRS